MSAESELYAAMTASAGLVALIGGRFFPDAIPEDSDLPAVVYQRAGTTPIVTVGGLQVAEIVRFTLSAWSATRTGADAVADQIVAVMTTVGNPLVDRSTGYDPETGFHAVTIETDWWRA